MAGYAIKRTAAPPLMDLELAVVVDFGEQKVRQGIHRVLEGPQESMPLSPFVFLRPHAFALQSNLPKASTTPMRSQSQARTFRSPVLRLLVAVLGVGCVTVPTQVVRVSTVQIISAEKSSAHYAKPPSVVFDAIKIELERRGFMLANQVDGKSTGAKFYVFKGARKDVTHVRGNSRIIVAETHEVGSMFVARIVAAGGGTDLLLLGKPTIGGVDLCSDADAMLTDGGYWCNDTAIRSDYPGLALMSGREEVDVVQGTLAALAEKLK